MAFGSIRYILSVTLRRVAGMEFVSGAVQWLCDESPVKAGIYWQAVQRKWTFSPHVCVHVHVSVTENLFPADTGRTCKIVACLHKLLTSSTSESHVSFGPLRPSFSLFGYSHLRRVAFGPIGVSPPQSGKRPHPQQGWRPRAGCSSPPHQTPDWFFKLLFWNINRDPLAMHGWYHLCNVIIHSETLVAFIFEKNLKMLGKMGWRQNAQYLNAVLFIYLFLIKMQSMQNLPFENQNVSVYHGKLDQWEIWFYLFSSLNRNSVVSG